MAHHAQDRHLVDAHAHHEGNTSVHHQAGHTPDPDHGGNGHDRKPGTGDSHPLHSRHCHEHDAVDHRDAADGHDPVDYRNETGDVKAPKSEPSPEPVENHEPAH